MAKASAKKTGKGKGAKPARARKTAAAKGGNGRDLHLGDNGGNQEAIQASFLQHRGRWTSALAKLKIAEKDLKDVVADAKSEGFLKLHFQIADMLAAGPKKEAKVVAAVKHRLEVARWIGHAMGRKFDPNQMDMFAADPDKPDADPVQAAYDAGEQAGLAGQTLTVPGQYSANDLQEAYASGWHKGQNAIQKGIKPLDKPADAPPAGWGDTKAAQA